MVRQPDPNDTTNQVTQTSGSTDDFFGEQDHEQSELERREREIEALRRTHMTAGIREGTASAHDAYLQEGFDEGFLEGAKASAEAGFMLGVSTTLAAFFDQGGTNLKKSHVGYQVEDSEVPIQDVIAVSQKAMQLKEELRELKQGMNIDLRESKLTCKRMAIFKAPVDYNAEA